MTDDRETAALPQGREHTGVKWLFVGSDGLRAGWGLALYIVLFAVIITVLSFADLAIEGRPPRGHFAPAPLHMMLNELVGFAACAIAAFVLSIIERRPFTEYGLRREHALPDLLHGFGWGVVMLSALIGLLWAMGALVFDGFALRGGAVLGYGLAWFVVFCLVGLFEEYLTRGYLQYTLARGIAGIVKAVAPRSRRGRTIGFWVAACVFSVGIFAGGHLGNPGETTMGIVSVALAGLTFVYVLYRTGSLWWAIGFHATWDWMQSFVYGVRDSGLAVQGHLLNAHPVGGALLSGGATGPEGSVLVVPVLLVTILIIHTTLPRRHTAFDAARAD